jgi:hypothetical protein
MRNLVNLCALQLVFAIGAPAQEPATLPRLTNKEIIKMVRAGISAGVIVAKIKISRCSFEHK